MIDLVKRATLRREATHAVRVSVRRRAVISEDPSIVVIRRVIWLSFSKSRRDHAQSNHVLKTFDGPYNDCSMGPRTRIRYIEMITSGLRRVHSSFSNVVSEATGWPHKSALGIHNRAEMLQLRGEASRTFQTCNKHFNIRNNAVMIQEPPPRLRYFSRGCGTRALPIYEEWLGWSRPGSASQSLS